MRRMLVPYTKEISITFTPIHQSASQPLLFVESCPAYRKKKLKQRSFVRCGIVIPVFSCNSRPWCHWEENLKPRRLKYECDVLNGNLNMLQERQRKLLDRGG